MRTLDNIPVQFFSPALSTRFDRYQALNPRPELIVVARVAADLMQWIDASWIAGLARIGRDLHVVCVMGDPPNLQACLEYVSEMLRSPHETEAFPRARGGGYPAIVSVISNLNGIEPILAIGPAKKHSFYSERDRELVRDLSASIAGLLGNARLAKAVSTEVIASDRLRSEFETAQEIQERFLPAGAPHVDGIEYHGRSQRSGCLGGDFFGFLRPVETELLMTVGKVAPEGAAAALLGAGLQATLRTLLTHERDMASILQELNRMMWEVSPGDVFGSLLCARVHPTHRRLEYASAGHDTALIIRARGNRVERLQPSGAVLGLSRRSTYAQRSTSFEPGDVLVAVTEGIADAPAPGNVPAVTALQEIFRGLVNSTPQDSARLVLEAVEAISGPSACPADRTIAVVRANRQSAKAMAVSARGLAA